MESDNEKKGNHEVKARGAHQTELRIGKKETVVASASKKGNVPMGLISGKQKGCVMYENKSFEDYLS